MKKFLSTIFSINNQSEQRIIVKVFGFKISFQKKEFSDKRKQNPYYYYKKNNVDITKIPPAEGDVRFKQLFSTYLLEQLDLICKANNIQYWLDFGSLIGAVRHSGFIPWDDDIDIGIMRQDYNRLLEIFNSNVSDKDLYITITASESGALMKLCHKRINHISIDIFPYDFYTKNLTEKERFSFTKKYKTLRKKFLKLKKSKNPKEFHDSFQSITKDFVSSNSATPFVIWGFEFGHTWKTWIHSYDDIFPLIELSFEGKKYPCIKNYDKYLCDVYGNYMTYPKKISLGHYMYKEFDAESMKLINNIAKLVINQNIRRGN